MGQKGAQWKCPRCRGRGVRKAKKAGSGPHAPWGNDPYLCEHCVKIATPEQLRARARRDEIDVAVGDEIAVSRPRRLVRTLRVKGRPS